jgi:hypothetical protein
MTTEERLEKVERELARAKQRSRWLLTALGLGLGTLMLVWTSAASVPLAEAQATGFGRTVRAERFELVDGQGTIRATLSLIAEQPLLGLADENGKPHTVLGMTKEGSMLTLGDATSKPRFLVRVTKEGPTLILHDENGKPRTMLGALKDGPLLGFLDENGKPLWRAP